MRALLIIICFFSCSTDQPTGKVVKVIDGDTFDLMSDKKIRIRIFGIDSPERGQAFNVKRGSSPQDLSREKRSM